MNSTGAFKKAKALWRKNACIKDMGPSRPSSAGLREVARENYASIKARYTPEQVKALPTGERKAFQDMRNDSAYACHHYRFSVGFVAMGMFFSVQGQGDTWEEAFEAAAKRASK